MVELAEPTAVPIRKPLFFERRRFAPPAWLLVLVPIPAQVLPAHDLVETEL